MTTRSEVLPACSLAPHFLLHVGLFHGAGFAFFPNGVRFPSYSVGVFKSFLHGESHRFFISELGDGWYCRVAALFIVEKISDHT